MTSEIQCGWKLSPSINSTRYNQMWSKCNHPTVGGVAIPKAPTGKCPWSLSCCISLATAQKPASTLTQKMSPARSTRIEVIPTMKPHETAGDSEGEWLVTSRDGKVTQCEGSLGNKEEVVGREALIPIDGSKEQKQEGDGERWESKRENTSLWEAKILRCDFPYCLLYKE